MVEQCNELHNKTHSLNAYGYFRDEIAALMPLTGDTTIDVREMYSRIEAGDSALKALRQKGKGPTFGLSYGAFPPKVAATLKISLAAAEAIFNSYHNELYPGITRYREEYVLPTTLEKGQIHMGLGCYIKSDNPDSDIRTLHNATVQFWSILTLLTINKMHHLIDRQGYQNDIQCISSIYDSIYYIVKKDPKVIAWLNNNLVEVMTKDFMENQRIKNEATSEIGTDWSNLVQLKHNATEAEISAILKDFI